MSSERKITRISDAKRLADARARLSDCRVCVTWHPERGYELHFEDDHDYDHRAVVYVTW